MVYGIAVSVAGKNTSSSEPRDFVLNSQYDTFKIVATGSGTLSVNAGSTNSVSIAHGLSFVPLVMFWCELSPGSGKWFFGHCDLNAGDTDAGDVAVETYLTGAGPYDYGATYVDSTYFRLQLYNKGGSTKVVPYFYMFFGDTSEV